MAKRTDFISGSSSDEKRKKRLEIKTQSVFNFSPSSKLKIGESRSSSSRKNAAAGSSHERARQTLLKACGKMDTGIFSGTRRSDGRGTPTKDKRNSLGIRTVK